MKNIKKTETEGVLSTRVEQLHVENNNKFNNFNTI